MYRGDVPASKALRLLRWSPPESAFRASVAGGPERMGWTGPGAVMADVWDLLAGIYTEKGKTPPSHPRFGKPKSGGMSLANVWKNKRSKGRGDG